MARQSADDVATVEASGDDVVEQHHHFSSLVLHTQVYDAEIIVRVEYVEVFNHLGVSDVALTEARCLVEHREGVSHSAVSLFGYHVESLLLIFYPLLLSHHLQMVHDARHRHALEVVNLAARQDGGQNLVLLRCSEDEDDVCRRFFESLQKGIESLCGEHVHLVDDEHLVASHLGRDAGLVHQRLDVFHRVVACRIELKDVV